jgi:hypothetical protein
LPLTRSGKLVGITGTSRLRLLALAIAGAACGHTLAYALSFPDRMARQSVLRVTGHAYWHAAVAAAIVAALWFATGHVARHVRAGRRRDPIGPGVTFAGLAALQLAVFGGMEIVERVAVGAPVSTVLDHRILVVGCAVQLAVAALLTRATSLLGRVAEAIGRAFAARPARRTSAHVAGAVQRFVATLTVVSCGSRAPPASRAPH